MRRAPHENVATVLVDPCVLPDLELSLMLLDLRVWPVATAAASPDGPRQAFQIRRRMVLRQQGDWDLAAAWTPVWVSFGRSWRQGEEPLPWAAHKALWDALAQHQEGVRFHRRLGGVPPLPLPQDVDA